MKYLHEIFYYQFFTPLFPILSAIINLIVGVKLQKTIQFFELFRFYAFAYLLIYIMTGMLDLFKINIHTSKIFFDNWDNFFTLLEFCLYMIFFNRVLKQKKI